MDSALVSMDSALVSMDSALVSMDSALVSMDSALVSKEKKSLQPLFRMGCSDFTFPLKSSLKSILKSARARKIVDNFLIRRKLGSGSEQKTTNKESLCDKIFKWGIYPQTPPRGSTPKHPTLAGRQGCLHCV